MDTKNEKTFYTNVFSGSYLTQSEFKHWVKDFKSEYTLVDTVSKSGIKGFKVVFIDNNKLQEILA